MSGAIEHSGTVVAVEEGRVDVELAVGDACEACSAKILCGMGVSDRKVVHVFTSMAGYYAVGEQVEVSVERYMGVKAVVYAYIVPFVLMLAVLLILFGAGANDLVAGLSCLGAVGIYYLVFYFFRHRFEKEITFKINKI